MNILIFSPSNLRDTSGFDFLTRKTIKQLEMRVQLPRMMQI